MEPLSLISRAPCTPQNPLRVGVLASGQGSNLQALLDASSGLDSLFRVVCVVSNIAGAHALERASQRNIPTSTVNHRSFSSKSLFESTLVQSLGKHDVELVVLAGFMRVLGNTFLSAFPNRVVNIHPALNPAFPGMHAAKQALDHGVWYTGCTVHLVNEGVDTGPIIAQEIVPVLADDDEVSLQKRIQTKEHALLPQVVHAIAEGRIDRNRFLRHSVD